MFVNCLEDVIEIGFVFIIKGGREELEDVEWCLFL